MLYDPQLETGGMAMLLKIKRPKLHKIYVYGFSLTFVVIIVLATGRSSIELAGAQEDGMRKVVYHADFSDPRRFSSMLQSINNMIVTYEDELADYDIRVVFNAHGIRFLTEDKLTGTPFEEDEALRERRQELMDRLTSLHDVLNVKLELCEITRTAVGLDKQKVMPVVELVPSGVVQVAALQHQGFAYIKVE
jgi:intracellular sulfur oxidation DsrE/DsrF family protein